MTEPTTPSSRTYFSQLPVSAIVAYNMLTSRLAGHPLVTSFRKYLSHGITLALLLISVLGFYELGTLLVPMIHTTKPAASVAAPVTRPAVKKPVGLSRSIPTSLSIPSIGVSADVVGVGLTSEGSLDVPGPEQVGWYTAGPTPGEVGPAVIDGHVDYVTIGPAVFWNLRNLKPGDKIQIARQDGKTVTFTVQKTESYDQGNFPTKEVYSNINYPGLRLITCDGNFSYVTHHYSNDLVVFAKADL